MDHTLSFDLELSLPSMSKFTVILNSVKNPELEMITSPFNLYVRKPNDI
jgi:hypothetical protein